MNRVVTLASVGAFIILLEAACSGSYDYRKRIDGSEVAVVRSIQETWPEFAIEVKAALDSLDVKSIDANIGHAELQNKIARLYEEKDQVNAQLHDFITARYQSYINSELDGNPSLRAKGREKWDRTVEKVHLAAMQIREKATVLQKQAKKVSDADDHLKQAVAQQIRLRQTGSSMDPVGRDLALRDAERHHDFWDMAFKQSTTELEKNLNLVETVGAILHDEKQ